MLTRVGLLALACCAVFWAGCAGPTRVNTVPWWKGLPCLVIAPSSIEAHAWRQHLHQRHGAQPSSAVEPCVCETLPQEFAPGETDGDWAAPLPDDGSPPAEQPGDEQQ